MADADCIFCKIVSGAIPCSKIHETADCLAFLDVGPLAFGHTLLIPKRHFVNAFDIPADIFASLSGEIPLLASALMKVTGATGLNVLQNSGASSGQVVMHLHIHLIPRREGDGLGYRWNSTKYPPGEAAAIQSKIIAALGSKAG